MGDRDPVQEIYVAIGENVRHYRKQAKLSQLELSRQVDLTRASIANLETGRQRILLHTAFDLARALNVSVDDLVPHFSPRARDIIRIPFKAFPKAEAA